MSETKAELIDKVASLEKTIENLNEATKEFNSKVEKFDSITSLSPQEYAYWHTLNQGDRESFLVKSAAERQILAKATEEPEEIYKGLDGESYVKGEEKSAALHKRLDIAELSKEAAEQYGSLPGTDAEKAELLLFMKSAPESVRNTFDTLTKAGQAAMGKTGYMTRATVVSKEEGGSALQQLETIAKEIEKTRHVSYSSAYLSATDENPQLFAKAIEEEQN